jgi:hypothetical protein
VMLVTFAGLRSVAYCSPKPQNPKG